MTYFGSQELLELMLIGQKPSSLLLAADLQMPNNITAIVPNLR
jgi:hypothetical protein